MLSGFKQSGSVNLAQTKDRLIALKRRMAYHQATGLHCEVLITLTWTEKMFLAKLHVNSSGVQWIIFVWEQAHMLLSLKNGD